MIIPYFWAIAMLDRVVWVIDHVPYVGSKFTHSFSWLNQRGFYCDEPTIKTYNQIDTIYFILLFHAISSEFPFGSLCTLELVLEIFYILN